MVIVVAVCVAGFFSLRGAMPFMPVFGVSMQPELKAGDLIMISDVDPNDVKVGDIIVFTVPSAVREFYNYPPVVAHRVTEIRDMEQAGKGFRTKGDNTGGDPFTVRSQDILGIASTRIPYIGFILLFFQSSQGTMFIIISVVLLGLFLYVDEINRGRQRLQEGIFSPVINANRQIIEESQHGNELVAAKVVSTEKRMDSLEHTLVKLGSAIELYAENIKSHTSAIQGLSAASQDLARSTAEQEKILGRLSHAFEDKPLVSPEKAVTPPPPPRVEKVVPEIPGVSYIPSGPTTAQPYRQMGFNPVPVAPVWRARGAEHTPDITRTSPLHFARREKPEAVKAETTSEPAVPARKEMPVPGHWRNQRRVN